MDFSRTLIIGNSGAGKSWLASRMKNQLDIPWIDLDRINWLSDEHSIARPRNEVLVITRIAADEEYWVIEGVYGWIIREIIHRATALIWLCVADDDCVANIRQREETENERLVAMLESAASYRTRDDSSGFSAHQRLFDRFGGFKLQLKCRTETTAFISHL
jgi:adenylate kinase family enzyme